MAREYTQEIPRKRAWDADVNQQFLNLDEGLQGVRDNLQDQINDNKNDITTNTNEIVEARQSNPSLDARITSDVSNLQSQITDNTNEITEARGTTASLNTRLSVSMNPDGTLKSEPPAGGWWIAESDIISHVSTNSFSIAGDKTAIYTLYRAVRLNNITTGHISSSEYDSVNDKTLVTVDCNVPDPLTVVEYGQEVANSPLLCVSVAENRKPTPDDDIYSVGTSWIYGDDFYLCTKKEPNYARWRKRDGELIWRLPKLTVNGPTEVGAGSQSTFTVSPDPDAQEVVWDIAGDFTVISGALTGTKNPSITIIWNTEGATNTVRATQLGDNNTIFDSLISEPLNVTVKQTVYCGYTYCGNAYCGQPIN